MAPTCSVSAMMRRGSCLQLTYPQKINRSTRPPFFHPNPRSRNMGEFSRQMEEVALLLARAGSGAKEEVSRTFECASDSMSHCV